MDLVDWESGKKSQGDFVFEVNSQLLLSLCFQNKPYSIDSFVKHNNTNKLVSIISDCCVTNSAKYFLVQ